MSEPFAELDMVELATEAASALQRRSDYLRSDASREVSVPQSIKEILVIIQDIKRLREDLIKMDARVNTYQLDSAISNLRFVAGELLTLK